MLHDLRRARRQTCRARAARADELVPPDGVVERVQLARIVDAIGIDLRQIRTLDGQGAGLHLPDDRELLTGRVVLDADQRDKLLAPWRDVTRDVPPEARSG